MADYRHFAHGRHHWLAKNDRTTGVLALLSMRDRSLARRTLNLLPTSIPRAVIDVPGPQETAQLLSLLAGLFVTEELSFARGIDPGQPGVPEFGRKLYGLNLGKDVPRTRHQVSVARKQSARATAKNQPDRQALNEQLAATHRSFEQQLAATPLGGVVLDYDGTVVDTPERFAPPNDDLVAEMLRILSADLRLGIATGRGASAGKDLRAVVPETYWPTITVGYYNGAVVRDLSDTELLNAPGCASKRLSLVHDTLRAYDGALRLTLRQHQLTVEAEGGQPEDRLWADVQALVNELQVPLLRVVRSSHSIDVLESNTTKLNVVEAVAARARTIDILRIGDRGRWPGNDFELLNSPLGLSVDQVSASINTCWNIAPEGIRGSRATLYYLRSIQIDSGLGWLQLGEE
jgi:hypothetical protein